MPVKKKTISINPATGKIIGHTPVNTVEELERAVALVKIAQPDWIKLSFDERASHLFRIRDYIVENTDRIADIISRDNGKTKIDALRYLKCFLLQWRSRIMQKMLEKC